MKQFASVVPPFAKVIFTLFAVLCATGVFAQLGTLSVQGVLTKADGTAVDDGSYSIEFSLWKSESSTNTADRVHVETIATQTTGGVYSVILGLGTPFSGAATFAEVYYLGVKFGSTELLPRPRLTSAPYALALLGSTNVFPGTGMVTCDAITVAGSVNIGSATATGALNANHFVAAGGAPAAGVAGKGYSFNNAGDQDGGLFSLGDNNVALYANALKALEASGSGVSIPGTLSVTGNTTLGTVTSGAQTVNNGQTVNGQSTVNGNVRANAFRARGGAPGFNGVNNNGYAFEGNGGDNDSGLFSYQDGVVSLYSGDGERVKVQNSLVEIFPRLNVGGELYLYNRPFFDGGNMQINTSTGLVGYDNSSRRYKENIKPLEDDFALILKAMPKTYTRAVNPDHWEVGYIAEEMDSLGLKKLVDYDQEGIPSGYNYEKMILYVNEMLKMHHAEIEALKAEVAALTAEKNALRDENKTLRTENTTLQGQQETFGKQLEAISRRIQLLETTAGNR